MSKHTRKWRSIIGLALMYVAIMLNITWVWGLFYLFWVVPDIVTRRTYFMEEIDRDEHPVLYFVVVISFLFLAIYTLTLFPK